VSYKPFHGRRTDSSVALINKAGICSQAAQTTWTAGIPVRFTINPDEDPMDSQTGTHDTDNLKPATKKSLRGFAAMDPQRQREIASLGGRAAHQSGHAHEFTSEEARAAGKKRHARAEGDTPHAS
jgi:general stress protein YciG